VKTLKQLTEEHDELRFEARGIAQTAQDQGNRDWTPEEDSRFKEITAEGTGLLAVLEEQIKQAKAREATILRLAQEENRKKIVDRLNTESDELSRPRVLPTNGVLPEDEPHRSDIRVRTSKLRAFKNVTEAWNAGMWLRSIVAKMHGNQDKVADLHCHRVGMDVSNSSYEGSGVAGGYLVPPQMAQTIIDVRESVGIARRVCQIQAMTSDMVSIPKRAGGLTVYYPNELATITDSDKTWGQINLAAEKRAVASKISQELQDDALISIVDNVVSEMAYALALQEDNELINGTGASSYGHVLGLRSSLTGVGTAGIYTCDSNENLWSEIDLEDVIATMAKLPDRYNRSPVWICSSNFYWAVFARLLAAAGGNTIRDMESGPGGMKSFMGSPVYTTSQMPTADSDSVVHALFGQFDMGVILGDRTGIRVSRDDSTGFLSDYTTLKATARYDIHVHEPGDSSNAGAYVGLKTNAA
jgi:HK97 family phage major capsid protein